ncbi:MAG TPA: SCP2 sterol-binding domain-containing protein [Micromonosporaceae bacterium]
MAGNATLAFFEGLDRRRHEPLLEKIKGTVRFDLQHRGQTEHWLVAIDRGDLAVSREEQDADSVVATDPELFEQLANGTENGVAAGLRGALTIVGSLHLYLMLERLFPSPPDSQGPRRRIRREGRQ